MAINKLNKTFINEQILTATEMNQVSSKIDEIIDGVNTIPASNAILTKTEAQNTYLNKTDANNIYATKTTVNNKGDKIVMQTVTGATPTQEISSNKFYKFEEVTSLTITLAAETSNVYNEYLFQFTSGTTPTVLNLPETVKWIGDNTIEANKTYIVSIVSNLAVLGGA